jgi:hypothetical protein
MNLRTPESVAARVGFKILLRVRCWTELGRPRP